MRFSGAVLASCVCLAAFFPVPGSAIKLRLVLQASKDAKSAPRNVSPFSPLPLSPPDTSLRDSPPLRSKPPESEASEEDAAAALELRRRRETEHPLDSVAQALPPFGLVSLSLRSAVEALSPLINGRTVDEVQAGVTASVGGLRFAMMLAASLAANLLVTRATLPRLVSFLKDAQIGGLDLSPGAVVRNVADWAAENAAGDMWSRVGGFTWFKRLALGIDEEESGLWSFIRFLLLGLKEGKTCAAWRFSRWAAMGLPPDNALQPPHTRIEVGVRVRFDGEEEEEVKGGGAAVPYICELTRNCADAVLDLYLSPGTWMWTKRLLLDIDEEEGTGLWRLAKNLACGLKQGDVGVYTIQQPDQYPLLDMPVWRTLRYALLGLTGPAPTHEQKM